MAKYTFVITSDKHGDAYLHYCYKNKEFLIGRWSKKDQEDEVAFEEAVVKACEYFRDTFLT
jgi:hypothetical protein